jgi:hypothetical protein
MRKKRFEMQGKEISLEILKYDKKLSLKKQN